MTILTKMPQIALVAGELSGDLLGTGLIAALRMHYPHARFGGIGGPGMIKQGLRSLVPLEWLVALEIVDAIGPKCVRTTLKKTYSSRGGASSG